MAVLVSLSSCDSNDPYVGEARRQTFPTGPVLSTPEGVLEALATGQRYVEDRGFRRKALEDSLLHVDNHYARLRLEKYGIPNQWEALPVLNLPTAPLTVNAEGLLTSEPPKSLNLGEFEWEHAAVLRAGQRAFEQWPIRRRTLLEREFSPGEILSERALATQGLWKDERGRVGGMVAVEYPDGSSGLSFSCASCHARVDLSGQLEVGGNSDVRLGPVDVDARELWTPGTVDVTADGVNNPVRVADLRATRWQSRLHHTGNVANGLIALAVRIETLLITNVFEGARPPREVAFALAYYLWDLGEQAAAQKIAEEQVQEFEGRRLFERDCVACHRSATGAGDWVSVGSVNSDPAAAHSTARGTGGYRVPSLLGFLERRLGHEGKVADLAAWLLPEPVSGQGAHLSELAYSAQEVKQLESHLSKVYRARD